jgi:hypothetical protein
MVVHACSLSSWKAEAEGLRAQSWPGLHKILSQKTKQTKPQQQQRTDVSKEAEPH